MSALRRRSFLFGGAVLATTAATRRSAARPSPPTRSTVVRLAKKTTIHRENQAISLSHADVGSCTLNETAARTVELVDGRRSIDDVARALAAEYDAPLDECTRDVSELVHRLLLRGFLEG